MQTLIDYQQCLDKIVEHIVQNETIEDRTLFLEQLNTFAPTQKKERGRLVQAVLNDTLSQFHLQLRPDGFLLVDSEERSVLGSTFEMPYFIEMMGLTYLIGLRYRQQHLIEQAVKMAHASLQLLDRNAQLPLGFASSEYLDDEAMRATYASVMRSMANLGGCREFVGVGQCDLTSSIAQAIDQIEEAPFFPQVAPQKKSLPFFNLSDRHMTLLVDSFGHHTSWVTFESEGIEVRAFGMGVEPLGQMEHFGTHRMIDEACEDHLLSEEGDVTHLKGWSRLADRKTFAHLSVRKELSNLNLHVRLAENELEPKLFALFFVKADSALVGESNRFELRSLDKYCGSVQNVTFWKGENHLNFEAGLKDEMHLIPLEGEHHFYGADYLLAYELSELDGKFEWKIYK